MCLEWSLSEHSGHWWVLARDGSVANDPTATLASISCCSGEADFSPYQSSRLSLYHGVV